MSQRKSKPGRQQRAELVEEAWAAVRDLEMDMPDKLQVLIHQWAPPAKKPGIESAESGAQCVHRAIEQHDGAVKNTARARC